MRLAVLADIHGNLRAFEAAWADIAARGDFDEIWCLGDLAAFGPRPADCVRRVLELREAMGEKKLRVIGGNTDRYLVHGMRPAWTPAAEDAGALRALAPAWTLRDRALNWSVEQLAWEEYDFLRGILGRELSLRAPGYGPVIGYHAIPGDDESMALRPDSPAEEALDALLDREGRLGIGGHTHLQMDRDLGQWRAVNVGSVGWSFGAPGMAEWGLFTFENGVATVELRRVPWNVNAVLQDFTTVRHPAPELFINQGRLR